MMQFASQFIDEQIVVTLSRQLSWSHLILLLPLKSIESKLFYAQKAVSERLGVRELRKHIESKVFERTSLANLQIQSKPETHNVI